MNAGQLEKTDRQREDHPLSRFISVSAFAVDEITCQVRAEPSELEALAENLGVLSIERLVGIAKLWQVNECKQARVRVNLLADVVQSCVVTLEPVLTRIEDTFERDYVTPGIELDEGATDASLTMQEVVVGVEGPDDPEPWSGDGIDLGTVISEYLALSIDPYPRKKNVEFESYQGEGGKRVGPFEALSRLKGDKGS